MKQQKDQHKVGSKQKPRGQQTGMAGARDQNRTQKKETPAILGRRKAANKMAGDKSAQNIGGGAVTPRTTAPSTPAMTTGKRKGESGGETIFKARLKATRSSKKRS
jgi:hypothetical protein